MLRQKRFMMIVVATIATLILVSQGSWCRAAIQETGVSVEKDACARESSPDTNYGTDTTISAGNRSGWWEIYVGFNLTSRPVTWDSVELVFKIASGVNISGYIQETDPTWDEGLLTWNNRPALKSYQENVPLNDTRGYIRINLTTYIHQYDINESSIHLSLVVNATPALDGNYCEVTTREWAAYLNDITRAPRLIWSTYQPDDYSWMIGLFAAIGGGGVATILITRYAYRNRATINWKRVGKLGLGITLIGWVVLNIIFWFVIDISLRFDFGWYVYFTPLLFIPFGILVRKGKKPLKKPEEPTEIDQELKFGT